MTEVSGIKLSLIHTDGGTQARAALRAADRLIPATKDETIIYQCTQAALHLDKAMQRAQALEE
jgi:hypothetical protein